MTELEYKLMSVIARAIDMVADISDDMDEYVLEVEEGMYMADSIRAMELGEDVLSINTLLGDVFNKAEEENKEEWITLQKAECKIIEKSISIKKGL